MKKIIVFLLTILIFISCINNADKNGKDKSEPTIEPVIESTIEATADNELLNYKLLEIAADGDIEKIEALLSQGADINYQESFQGTSILIKACLWEQYATVKYLVEHGADVNLADNEGFTPLFSVTAKENLELLKLMIEKGADVNATTIYGSTPLVSTVGQNNIEGVKILIEHGAEVKVKFNVNEDIYKEPVYKTVLQVAKENGYKEIIKLLIDAGAEE